MKTIIRNFLSVLRRFRTATVLNVLGLSTAFAAFMVIMMQVAYERGFDRMHPEAERIVRVDLAREDGYASIHARAFVDAMIASSPRIKAGSILNPFVGDIYVTVGEGEGKLGFRERFVTCYPAMAHIFGFSFVEGEADCLQDPEKVIIPQSMARRMFGDKPAVGEALAAREFIWTKAEPKTLTVGGVYRDFPGNTQLDNAVYTAIDHTMEGWWDAHNFICYLLLESGASVAGVEAEVNAGFDFSRIWNAQSEALGVRLTPLTELYLTGSNANGLFKSGNAATIRILLAIALLIIFIAGINFTNFSVAMAPSRVKSFNTQKVLGCSTALLRWALVSESLAIAAVSFAAGAGATALLDGYRFLSFMEADMNLAHNLPVVWLTAAVALATGLIAGLYPAYYITSFQPALALKGSFALSAAGRRLRAGLTGFQYVISIGLIVAAGFIQLQNKYIKTYDYGFDKSRIAIVTLSGDLYRGSKDAYVNGLKEYAGIEDVAFARQKLGALDLYSTYGITCEDRTHYGYVLDVSYNFTQVMGIAVEEGRDFMPADERPGAGVTFLFNRSLQEALQAVPGSVIDWRESKARMAGVAGDLKFTSLRQGADYIALTVNSGDALPVSFVRLRAGSDVAEAVVHIRRTLAGIDPSYPLDVAFYDDVFHQLYSQEEYVNRAITLLSLLAIVISVIGVFGLALFETQYRRREISVRKVFGATTGEILGMFNRVYFRTVCVSFVIASPVAWYAVSRWQENFAYRAPLYWWVFAAAFALVSLVTVATVTLQSRRAANTNPAESIQAE